MNKKLIAFIAASLITETTAIASTCDDISDVTATATSQALVFNQEKSLVDDFPLSRTLENIVRSHAKSIPNTPELSDAQVNAGIEILLDTMLDTYSEIEEIVENKGVEMEVDARFEATLRPIILADMRPTALFNRFDLADDGGAHCGEYRVVYNYIPNFDTGAQHVDGRFTLIFEAQYPNPLPEMGLAGCLPVTDFWASLKNRSEVDALEDIAEFFYEGRDHNGTFLPAVVDVAHYQEGAGQVRTNNFIGGELWQLREFNTGVSEGNAQFVRATVKSNSLAEFYGDVKNEGVDNNDAFNAAQAEFKADFLATNVEELLSPERNGITADNGIINGINISIDNKYNEFQSTAQTDTDIPQSMVSLSSTGQTFKEKIKVEIDRLLENKIDPENRPTPEHILNRAGAMTCGGCHNFSVGKEVAKGVTWPAADTFTHVIKTGALSPALTDVFLPARAENLKDFACNPPSPLSITLPVEGTVIINPDQTFEWEEIPNATGFVLVFSTDDDFFEGDGVFDTTNFSGSDFTSYTPENLPTDGSDVFVQFSVFIKGSRHFETVVKYSAATLPVMISPVEGSVLASSTQTFSWEQVPDAKAYFVELFTANDVIDGKLLSGDSLATSFTTDKLPTDGSDVFVLVRALVDNSVTTVGFDSQFEYTASTAVVAPVLSSLDYSTYWWGYRVRLHWDGAEAVDIYKDGALHTTNKTDKPFQVAYYFTQKHFEWKVCTAGTNICSETLQ